MYGCRVDPHGKYIRKYIPELANYPVGYIYEPWKAPLDIQEKAGCIIGCGYPEPMINHKEASDRNRKMMEELRKILLQKSNMKEPKHIKPSDESEIRVFFGLQSNES